MNETYIKGTYKRCIYQSANGYIVGIFKVIETNDQSLEEYIDKNITFTGYFHELNDIDTYLFYGHLVEHEKYGLQFQVTSYDRCKPVEKDAIKEFLTSGLFKGIGEVKAQKIVDVLGKHTLDTIINNPSNLILIEGITEKNIKTLHDKLLEYESSYDTIIKLTDMGFQTKESMLIYNFYKEKTLDIINENIYNLYFDMENLTFKRVDSIALRNNIKKTSKERIEASIIYIMNELTNQYGHSYYYLNELETFLPRVLTEIIPREDLIKALENLILDLKIVKVDDKYYVREIYDSEKLIVSRLNILQHEKDNKIPKMDKYIENLEEKFDITYNDEQKNAIINSCIKNILVITGGPGTGKTTIMKAICEIYKEVNKLTDEKLKEKIALLAPTGRAAKRMGETTLLTASTIHRFLHWNKDLNKFQVNEYNKSKKEFVIIDEASMIDTVLFANLLKGLSVNTKIILVGDVDQLPSVGPGQVLEDIIESEKINVVKLNELYRQKENSNIITLAYDIKNNHINENIFNKEEDLTFISCRKDEVIDKTKEIVKTYLDYSYKNFQILVPMYKTICGIDNMNIALQEIYNPKSRKKHEIKIGEEIYREQDKVIQLTNMPDDNIYNGDIGIIEKIITKPKKEIYIDFDGNLVKYTQSNFLNFKKAYAISIHKSQGSEFDIVIIPIVKNFNKMLYKKLIYTAITRSKRKLYLIGEQEALNIAVNNNKTDIRRTSIKDFLINGIK